MAVDWGVVQQGYNRHLLINWTVNQISNTFNGTDNQVTPATMAIAEVIVDTIEAAVRHDDAFTIQHSTYLSMMANSILRKINSEQPEPNEETKNDQAV